MLSSHRPMRLLAFACLLAVACHLSLGETQGKDRPITLVTKEDNLEYGLRKHVAAFKKKTGIDVEVVGVPYGDLYPAILEDLKNGSPKYDGFWYNPAWMYDYLPHLEVLTDRVRRDFDLEWTDVANFFRNNLAELDGEIYGLPADGDIHYAYYRIDLFKKYDLTPPRTWEEYIDAAEFFQNLPEKDRDFNGDGETDFVSCIGKAANTNGYWWLHDIVAPKVQHLGTSQGVFFDFNTMEPLVDNEGFRAAADIFYQTNKYGSPDQFEIGVGEARTYMVGGRCVLGLDWGDMPLVANETAYRAEIGTLVMMGSETVYNRETGTVEQCDLKLCPYATHYKEDGKLVNHAPYAAFGGWTGSIPSGISDERRDAVYEYFSFCSQPAQSNDDVTDGGTGLQVYRLSQLDRDLWTSFDADATESMLLALEITLKSRNIVVDFRLPRSQDYQEVVLDAAIFDFISANKMDIDTLVDTLHDEWDKITDEEGRIEQLQVYRDTIGLPPLEFSSEVEIDSGITITMMVLSSVCIAFALGVLLFVLLTWKMPIIRYSSPFFLVIIIVGAAMIYLGVLLFAQDPSTGTCTSALWMGMLGFTLMLSALFVKTFRIYRLFSNKSFKVLSVTTMSMLPYMAGALAITLIILTVWTIMDAPSDHRTSDGLDNDEYMYICDSPDHGMPFFITSVVYFGILLAIGCVLGFLTRNVAAAFNEARYVAISMYNFSFALLICVVVIVTVDLYTTVYLIVSCVVLASTTITMLALFVPKMYGVAMKKELSTSVWKGTGATQRTKHQHTMIGGPSDSSLTAESE